MDGNGPPRRTRAGRAIELIALAATLLVTFFAGGWISPWKSEPQKPTPAAQSFRTEMQTFDDSKDKQLLNDPGLEDPRQPEQRAVEARANFIHRDAVAIQAECQRSAGGNWAKWQQDTAPYRAHLKAKIDALKEVPYSGLDSPDARYQPLEGRNGFPLFELKSREYLNYLYEPEKLDDFRRDRPVLAVHRWLRDRGIDLIFVPVPKMTEVYVEHFLDPCPPDGIIAPQVRQTLLELLKEDVEAIDGTKLFRSLRDTDAEYLYHTADSHWAPRGMRIMAKEIADRIERYKFGARARYGLPVVKASPASYPFDENLPRYGFFGGWNALSAEQKKRALAVQPRTLAEVRTQGGREPPDDPTSPVLVIGNSYVYRFREQLVKELNLLTATRAEPNQTTEAFADFLRDPQLLAHCRVVVWIITNHHLTRFKPLPKPIADCLNASTSPSGSAPSPGSPSPP
jgi:hypothetical protein